MPSCGHDGTMTRSFTSDVTFPYQGRHTHVHDMVMSQVHEACLDWNRTPDPLIVKAVTSVWLCPEWGIFNKVTLNLKVQRGTLRALANTAFADTAV